MAYLTPGADLTPGVTPQLNATVPLPRAPSPSGNTLAVPPALPRRPYSPSVDSDHPVSETTTGLSIVVPEEQYPSEPSPGDLDSESTTSGITYQYPVDMGSAERASAGEAEPLTGLADVKHSPGRSGSGSSPRSR